MLTLAISIIFWVKRDSKNLGIAAIALSALGAILDLVMYGPAGIIDIIMLVINVLVFLKMNHKDDDNDLY
ncbi:MAG TPA: hypothetical protein PLS20_03165 [Ruminococcus flavefaciens]|nr:hypothetical protein [Ruminococcus flavefaciens]